MSEQAESVVYVAGCDDIRLRTKMISLLKKKGFTISLDTFYGFISPDVDACVLVHTDGASSFKAGYLRGKDKPVVALVQDSVSKSLYGLCSAATTKIEEVPELLEEHIRLTRAIKGMMADKAAE